MHCDTFSFHSQESSLFESCPESPDRLIRKSIEEESRLSDASLKKSVRDSHLIDFLNYDLLACKEDTRPLSIQSFTPFFSASANWLSAPSAKTAAFGSRPPFPPLPPLPTIKEDSSEVLCASNGLVWDSYPRPLSVFKDAEEQEALGLTSSYRLPVEVHKSTAQNRKRSKIPRSKIKNSIRIKIYTNVDEEVIVLKREQGSLDSMNSFLGTILRKLENCYGVSMQAIKLYLLFNDRSLKEVELFQGDPSSCLYTPLIMEYINEKAKIQVKALIQR